jgi:hypothetical protein
LTAEFGLKFYDTTAFAASMLILEDIYADDITCLSHMVFKIFPLGVPIEVGKENATAEHRLLVVNQISLVEHCATDELSFSKLLFVALLSK